MLKKLYVIGNGFDRYHDLNTEYSHFHKYLKKKKCELKRKDKHQVSLKDYLDDYFIMDLNDDALWKNFESNLDTFDYESFYDEYNYTDPLSEGFKPSEVFGLEDELTEKGEALIDDIRNAFEDWLMDIKIEDINKKLDLKNDAKFLSFNYTLVLENVYNIKSENILHIHGDIKTSSLIFGHNRELEMKPELNENGDSNRTMFTDSESASKIPFYMFKKPVNEIISKNIEFFESINDIDEIIVLGHSLSPIDIPYFEEIKKRTKDDTKWIVSFRGKKEQQEHFDTLQNIGISNKYFELFDMNDNRNISLNN